MRWNQSHSALNLPLVQIFQDFREIFQFPILDLWPDDPLGNQTKNLNNILILTTIIEQNSQPLFDTDLWIDHRLI